MRSDGQQPLAFDQALAHQTEFVVLEVAQATVDQLRRGGRGRSRKIVFLDEAYRQPAPRRIARDASTVDAAADNQQIEVLGPVNVHASRNLAFCARLG